MTAFLGSTDGALYVEVPSRLAALWRRLGFSVPDWAIPYDGDFPGDRIHTETVKRLGLLDRLRVLVGGHVVVRHVTIVSADGMPVRNASSVGVAAPDFRLRRW